VYKSRLLSALLLLAVTIPASSQAPAKKKSAPPQSPSPEAPAPVPATKEPETAPAPRVTVIRVQYLTNLDEVAEALQEIFEKLKIVASGQHSLIVVEDETAPEGLRTAEVVKAVQLIDIRGLKDGYWIGNQIVRLEGIDVRDIEKKFGELAAAAAGHEELKKAREKFDLVAVSRHVLVILPQEGNATYTIAEEQQAASLKRDLESIDAVITGRRREIEPLKNETEKWLATRTVRLENLQASAVVAALCGQEKDCAFKAVSDKVLVKVEQKAAGQKPEESMKNFQALDASLTKPSEASHTEELAENRVVRLFHLRDADKVAAALNNALATQSVKAIGVDLLLILPPGGDNTDRTDELKRFISLIDLPRPQIALQVWSYQMSSKDPGEVSKAFGIVRTAVADYNDRMTNALQAGWDNLVAKVETQKDNFFDDGFKSYVVEDYKSCGRRDLYCLGYPNAFSLSKPSLTKILLFLAAAKDPLRAGMDVVDAMEKLQPNTTTASTSTATPYCPPLPVTGVHGAGIANLGHFRAQLCELLNVNKRNVLRAAILDFLFQYKLTIQYPHDFVPYDLQRTAQTLDSLLTPVVDAFNRDLEDFIESMERGSAWPKTAPRSGKAGFSSRGLIKVASLSGKQAAVSGKTSNFFDITTPMTLAELLAKNELFKNAFPAPIIPEKAAMLAGIIANIAAQQQILAEIQRGMSLTITPTALDTASSAELNIDLEAGEDSASPNVTGGKTDPLDRVTKHHVNDIVRVESLKLFEISTFSLLVRHPQPDGAVPGLSQIWEAIFGFIPRFGHIFRWHRDPLETDNRSLAIVNALIVPTAMDLALSLRLEGDRELAAGGTRRFHRLSELPPQVRPYHKMRMDCLLNLLPPFASGSDSACSNARLSSVPADAR
jgi:hypothetical protein